MAEGLVCMKRGFLPNPRDPKYGLGAAAWHCPGAPPDPAWVSRGSGAGSLPSRVLASEPGWRWCGLQVSLLPSFWPLDTQGLPLRARLSPRCGPWVCHETNLSPLPLCPCDQYPRPRDTSFSGLSLEEYKLILSTGMGSAAAAVSGWFANGFLSGHRESSNKTALLDGKSCGIAHRKF